MIRPPSFLPLFQPTAVYFLPKFGRSAAVVQASPTVPVCSFVRRRAHTEKGLGPRAPPSGSRGSPWIYPWRAVRRHRKTEWGGFKKISHSSLRVRGCPLKAKKRSNIHCALHGKSLFSFRFSGILVLVTTFLIFVNLKFGSPWQKSRKGRRNGPRSCSLQQKKSKRTGLRGTVRSGTNK